MQSQRSSRASAYSQSPGPGWAPPRAPLPPHRLAKLANALGVSTPLPAMTFTGTFLSPSPTHSSNSLSETSSNAELPRRSVTPSTASALNFASSSQSKYLLHIIPPVHLPHEHESSGSSELALPPPTASGYHMQFRRGTLVALQSTLQAQLIVIAKEYALPSTMGIVLYLMTASPQSSQDNPMPYASLGLADGGEPGPRLSEEIWKHIWTRVLRAEREEAIALSRNPTPNPLGLGLSVEASGQSQTLRPLVTPTRTETPQSRPLAYPITPSTSTTSSVSDLRSQEKFAGASSSHSEPDTSDTSRSSDHGLSGIELPGLNSPSIIPILAKVEFDIDRRKATWYEPWVRSRRMRRAESRSSNRTGPRSHTGDDSNFSEEKRAPCDLKLVERMQKPAFLRSRDDYDEGEQPTNGEYALLSEYPDAIGDADATARTTSAPGSDPLRDIFGTDADTWVDIHAESEGKRWKVNDPNVVELALDATSLTAFPEHEQSQDEKVDEVDEVRDIMRQMSQPPLNVFVPASAERSSPSTAGGSKRPVPPPLVLASKSSSDDLMVPTEPSSMPSSDEGSKNLAYLNGGGYAPATMENTYFRDKEGSSLEMEQEYQRSRSPAEEKRVGTLFEDLDLGLDLGDDGEEYDENDPNDRRRSQYLMKAKLDEIERTLAQFSPRQLKTVTLDEDLTITHRHNSQPPTSAPPGIVGDGSSVDGSPSKSAGPSNTNKAWPAVSYSSMTKSTHSLSPPRPANLPPSPPQLALNGVTTGAPKAFIPPPLQLAYVSSTLLTETEIRRRELDQATYPTTIHPSLSRPTKITSDSPIPLSPDPFGRYPSVYDTDALPVPSFWDPTTQTFSHEPYDPRPSLSSVDDGSLASTTPSSRFSADSASIAMDHGDKITKTTAPLVSVKGFKKLWRRSKSTSGVVPQPPTPLSGPPPPTTSTDQRAAPIPSALLARNSNGRSPLGQLHFDQESPYPLHPSRPSLSGSRPTSPPAPFTNAMPQPPEKTSVRKSILKSWKSVSGAASQQPVNGSEPRKSSERPISNETIKPRWPSVLDGSIPPSPKLPDQYLPSNHARTGSTFFERRKSAGRSKVGPTQHYSSSSQDMLSTIPQQRSSVVMQAPGSASPSRSLLSASSRDSHAESRGSFETSQFEFVSPPKVHPNLSYPYQTLDHE